MVKLPAALVLSSLLIALPARAQDAFITTWRTAWSNGSITIPTNGGTEVTDYDFEIDWGDGTVETITGDDPNPSHVYESGAIHTVAITGTFPHFFLNSEPNDENPDADKLTSVDQWGTIEWESMNSAFEGADNMVLDATDAPDLTKVNSMAEMFKNANAFNGDISGWDVSNVTDMSSTFSGADSFNQDIGKWDVSNVTDMSDMFSFAEVFNRDISGWDVSNVTDMRWMFGGAETFNEDIGAWDVSTVTNMGAMFFFATTFNGDVSGWDVPNVNDMSSMFRYAYEFNGDISGWDVSSVTDMSRMFGSAYSFNQDIGGWDVSNVTDMSGMFNSTAVFNQDIGGWDVSSVTDMSVMFAYAAAFNQDIGKWDVSNVADMFNIFSSTQLSSNNYDALLIGWSELDLHNGLSFNAGSSQYTPSAAAAREAIITDDGWTINDGGLAPEASVSKMVDSDGLADFEATGADVNFSGVTGSGEVTVQLFGNAPDGTNGIEEANVSTYRLVITASSGLNFDSNTEVRLDIASFEGISDPQTVVLYSRPVEGVGSFTVLPTSIDDGDTSNDISDDVLVATIDSFSEFVLASDSNPLPVELTGFTATTDDEAVELSWRTASETNNAGFRVQRTADGSSEAWTKVGFVDGAGTTSEAQSYRFTDTDLPYGADRLAYRLEQVDTDGQTSLSDEVVIRRTVNKVELHPTFPNPARTRATVRYAAPDGMDVTLRVYDVLGRVVRTLADRPEQGHTEMPLDVSHLPSGVYFLRLRAGAEVKTQQLTVVK